MDLPGVPDFGSLDDVKKYLVEQFAGQYANFGKDLEGKFRKMLTEEHASVLVPQTTIDAAHALKNLTAASAAAIFAAFSIPSGSQASTSSTSTQVAVDYSGRGILTKALLAEVTSGASALRNGALFQITIDGNIVYTNSSALSRQSQILVVVGNLVDVSGTNLGLIDGHGFPFNSQCKIEYTTSSAGGDTVTAAWKIIKKA